MIRHKSIGLTASQLRRCEVHPPHKVLSTILRLRDCLRPEGAGRDNIRPRIEVCAMNRSNKIGAREHQHLIVALERTAVSRELLTAEVCLLQPLTLNHRSHSSVEHHDSLLKYISNGPCHIFLILD